jgi:hypothetical protein
VETAAIVPESPPPSPQLRADLTPTVKNQGLGSQAALNGIGA